MFKRSNVTVKQILQVFIAFYFLKLLKMSGFFHQIFVGPRIDNQQFLCVIRTF